MEVEVVMLVAVCVEEEEGSLGVGLGGVFLVVEGSQGQTEAVVDKGEEEDKAGNDNQVSFNLSLQLQWHLLLHRHLSPLQPLRLRTCLSRQLSNHHQRQLLPRGQRSTRLNRSWYGPFTHVTHLLILVGPSRASRIRERRTSR